MTKTYGFPVEAAAKGQPAPVAAAADKGWRDIVRLTLLMGITFASVYYAPISANRLVFLAFLLLAYRSKDDYLWLAWFFIINDAPGRLFSAEGLLDHRIPLYPLAAGASIEFQELFVFMYIAKAFFGGQRLEYIFKRAFTVFFIILGIFLLYSVLLGLSMKNGIQAFKYLIPWAWIFIIPYYLRSPEQIEKASRLLFPFVFLALALQIHTFVTGKYLDHILRGEKFIFNLAVDESSEVSRVWASVFILLYCSAQALFYMAAREKIFRYNYLAAIVFCSVASIFLSATRGWMLGIGFLAAASVFQMSKSGKIHRMINLALASVAVVFILQWSFPLVRHQFDAALERFSTLKLLASGDITAGGTLKRIDVRGKRVLQAFNENPVFGWGVSDTYFEYADGHVGPQNILLNVGVAGFVYLNLLYVFLCLKVWAFSQEKKVRAKWGGALIIYVLALVTIFIIHGSSTQFWGYVMQFEQTEKIITFSFLFASVNALVASVYRGEGETGRVGEGETR